MKEKQSIQLHTKFFDGQFIIKIKQRRGSYIEELLRQYFSGREEWIKAFCGYRVLFDALDFAIEETIDDRCRKELEEEVNTLYLD